ncbi:5364_t:CDS:2, partial [Acaulospora colombiana]
RLGGSIKHAASTVIHNMPSLTKARDQFRVLVDNGSSFRGRDPGRRYTAMSQNSPISQRSILDMNGGALGLTRGGDSRDIGFVTYPNASAANLSMIEEERARHSAYNPRSQRQFSDGSINRRETEDIRDGWDTSSRYPPPPPSMKSPTSTLNYPPTGPAKSSAGGNPPYPWSNRPVPSKITMPPLLGPQSPTGSSKAGFAGIGAGANYHRRAASVVVPGERNFASPHPSARLSMAGSIAGSESGRPPIAPKPQPPSRRSKIVNSINLDDPPGEGTPYQTPGHGATRSWSGEQRQIGRTTAMRPEFAGSQPLVTVEEKSPYLQGPNARGSTGSLNSVHSNRLKFDPKEYVDPAYLVPTDLTAVLEKQIGQPPPPSNEGPATSVMTKA